MKRRSFLKNTASAATLPLLLGGFNLQALGRDNLLNAMMLGETDHVLVLIQLNGGNDGLNTLLPLDQYANLSTARSNILIPQAAALKLNTQTGLHPSMGEMKQLWEDEKLGVVQSVGYPNPNFSHFRSTDVWTSGSPADENWPTGWIGRHLDRLHPGYPTGYPSGSFPDPLAITVGSIVSNTCQGPVANYSMAIPSIDSFQLLLTGGTAPAPNTPYGFELTFLRQTMLQSNQYLSVIQAAAQMGQNLSTLYPQDNPLAAQLKVVARLISGGLKTKFYVVNMGGFDTHANQVDLTDTKTGLHANLLQNISQAVNAFQDDLGKQSLEDRVVGMTFSEFGRRIASNGSGGTDHGSAAPMFVFGTQVNPILHGSNPLIPAQVATNDNLPMQYDFRSVFGSVLMDWFSVEEEAVKEILFDDFQHVPVIKSGATANDDLLDSSFALYQNFPNPFESNTRIRFQTDGGRVQIRIFDGKGSSIRILSDQTFSPGEHEIIFDGSELAAGVYYYRIQNRDQQQMKMMIKR